MPTAIVGDGIIGPDSDGDDAFDDDTYASVNPMRLSTKAWDNETGLEQARTRTSLTSASTY